MELALGVITGNIVGGFIVYHILRYFQKKRHAKIDQLMAQIEKEFDRLYGTEDRPVRV